MIPVMGVVAPGSLHARGSPLGQALAAAVSGLRADLGDPFAPITILLPAGPNGVLARRALATQGPTLRIWFETPEGLVRNQLPVTFWKTAHPEPPGWLRVTVARAVDRLGAAGKLQRFAEILGRPGWRDPLVTALARLEDELVTADLLAGLAEDDDTPAHLAERASLLGAILGAVEKARDEAGFASSRRLAVAARAALETPGIGSSLARGAIVVGDRELSQPLFEFLTTWLAARSVVRVVTPALEPLLAGRGLAAAAKSAPVVTVLAGGEPARLTTLKARLFQPAVAATALSPDLSVQFARTPDDVRECVECVREVQRSIRAGVPLDRIAIVVPDTRQLAALEEVLDRAKLPVTWLAGAPASELSSARLLRIAVDLACGDQTPHRLHELLGHPALSLRAALGPAAVSGRGRWRRLLSRVMLARGLDRIVSGLDRLPLDPDADAEYLEREKAARASLAACTLELARAISTLAQRGTLGAHARAWCAFLARYGRRSEARRRLLGRLEPIAASHSGPELAPEQAREELLATLTREVARGSLRERSIRVLAPMNLIGGEFDVVLLLGLTEGRFPTAAREDALLPDELLEHIGRKLGRQIPPSRTHEERERRRFAGAVAATRSRLWLSLPALDFDTEQPTLPSSFALEALSALLGRRTSYQDLQASEALVRAGSRARSYPTDAADAVGALEHQVTRLALGRAATLPTLASHAIARRVLKLHRSIDRARTGVLDAWTGLVPPSVLRAPGLDGAPCDVWALAELLADPGAFFFRYMLGAWRAPGLRPWRLPLERTTLEELLVEAAGETREPRGKVADIARKLAEATLHRLDEQKHLGAFDDAALGHATPVVHALGSLLAAHAGDFCRQSPLEKPLSVVSGQPWTLAAPAGRLVPGAGGTLTDVSRTVEHANLQPRDRYDLALSALALATAGHPVGSVVVLTPAGGASKWTASEKCSFETFIEPVVDLLATATKNAQEGRFPVAKAHGFALAAETAVAAAPGETGGEGA